jgi:hypothetical protein
MKTTLRISLLLNAGLLAGLVVCCCLALHHSSAPAAMPPPALLAVHVSAPASQSPAPRFHWSQLNADDYHFYVKNLRDIGCPELSVRAIVTADVNVVYDKLRRELAQQLAVLTNAPLAGNLQAYNDRQASQSALQTELQNLPTEAAAKIEELLGYGPLPEPGSASPEPALHPRVQPAAPVTLPLAMESVDLAAVDLSDQQIQAINALRQSFLDKIGGPDQDPNDPAYQARWQRAQPEADEILNHIIGDDGMEEMRIFVLSNAQAQAQAEAQSAAPANPPPAAPPDGSQPYTEVNSQPPDNAPANMQDNVQTTDPAANP